MQAKSSIGIYGSADHARASALANELRAAKAAATIRVRNAALFTVDQKEAFDTVYVDGDFPLVLEAYPGALPFPVSDAIDVSEDAPPARRGRPPNKV